MITSALNIAVTGLQASSLRLQTSANNVANVSSTVTVKNGERVNEPYQAQETVQQSTNPGVRAEVRTQDPATVQRFDPDNVAANEEGITEFPNVNLDEEVVTQQIASYDFQANLKVIETSDEMMEGLLNIRA